MKLDKRYTTRTKTVLCRGMVLDVPQDAAYLAVDSDGEMYAYEYKPTKGTTAWTQEIGTLTLVALVDFEPGESWEDSCEEVQMWEEWTDKDPAQPNDNAKLRGILPPDSPETLLTTIKQQGEEIGRLKQQIQARESLQAKKDATLEQELKVRQAQLQEKDARIKELTEEVKLLNQAGSVLERRCLGLRQTLDQHKQNYDTELYAKLRKENEYLKQVIQRMDQQLKDRDDALGKGAGNLKLLTEIEALRNQLEKAKQAATRKAHAEDETPVDNSQARSNYWQAQVAHWKAQAEYYQERFEECTNALKPLANLLDGVRH